MKTVFTLISAAFLITTPAFAVKKVICGANDTLLNNRLNSSAPPKDISAPSVSIAKAAPGIATGGHYDNPPQTKVETQVIICVTAEY